VSNTTNEPDEHEMTVPVVINPEAVGDPNQTPRVRLYRAAHALGYSARGRDAQWCLDQAVRFGLLDTPAPTEETP
jgi:hypothetical protein